jgi:hypothetical protein
MTDRITADLGCLLAPLRQLHASDQALCNAIGQLAYAYQVFCASGGKSSQAKDAVAAASKKLSPSSPGTAS